MQWPQITIICIYALAGGVMLANHGKPRQGRYNVWAWSIVNGAILYTLSCGGFFG